MCSIMGYTAKDIRLEDLRKGFDKTVSRGPDMSRTLETPAGWLFFHRLAIMGLTEEGMRRLSWTVPPSSATASSMASVPLKRSSGEKATPSKVIPTAKFYSLSTKKRAPRCSKSLTPSSP